MLSEEDQRKIIINNKDTIISNLQSNSISKTEIIRIFITLKILNDEVELSSKIEITRSILIAILLERFFQLNDKDQISFFKNQINYITNEYCIVFE